MLTVIPVFIPVLVMVFVMLVSECDTGSGYQEQRERMIVVIIRLMAL